MATCECNTQPIPISTLSPITQYWPIFTEEWIFAFLPLNSFAGQPFKVKSPLIDSLQYYHSSTKHTASDKSRNLVRLTRSISYQSNNIDSVYKYANLIFERYANSITESDSINVYLTLSNSNLRGGNYTKALFEVNKAININTLDTSLLIRIYNRRAYLYSKLNMTPEAVIDYLKLKTYSHLMDMKQQYRLYHNLANHVEDRQIKLELRLKVYNQRKQSYKSNPSTINRFDLAAASINLCVNYIEINKS